MASKGESFVVDLGISDDKPKKRKIPRKHLQTLVQVLKRKYCTDPENFRPSANFTIVFHGKPKSSGDAELDYLRNMVGHFCLVHAACGKYL